MKEEVCRECKNTNGEHKPGCSRSRREMKNDVDATAITNDAQLIVDEIYFGSWEAFIAKVPQSHLQTMAKFWLLKSEIEKEILDAIDGLKTTSVPEVMCISVADDLQERILDKLKEVADER